MTDPKRPTLEERVLGLHISLSDGDFIRLRAALGLAYLDGKRDGVEAAAAYVRGLDEYHLTTSIAKGIRALLDGGDDGKVS